MKKFSWYLIFPLATVLILGGAGCSTTNEDTTRTGEQTTTPTPTPTPTEEPAPTPTPKPTPAPTAPTPAPTATGKSTYYGISGVDKVGSVTSGYLSTSKVYKDSGFYYQFVSCHGSPGILTMKAGTKFMLDNRDKTKHSIVLGSTTYVLPGYGYIIATAPHVYGTQHLVCDGGGAALIKVEK